MRDIACVMITCDRSPQSNYLGDTLFYISSSAHASRRLRGGLMVMDNSPNAPAYAWEYTPGPLSGGAFGGCARANGCANEAVAECLGTAVFRSSARWVLFLEDDIDVCADFFDSVGAWLDDHAREDRRIYSFGANYPQVQELYGQGIYAWDYPIEKFYGTQAFAIRPDDALSLAEYIRSHCYDRSPDGTQWDLLMQDWSREAYPEIDHFLASCPAFVQHIGTESVVMPGRKGHRYPSWPGREWSYLKEMAK